MRLTISSTAALAGCVLLQTALGYPGMKATMNKLLNLKSKDCCKSDELLGDLVWLEKHQYSHVGRDIAKILGGDLSGESNEYYSRQLPPLGSRGCARDTCCVWQYIAYDMERLFRSHDGTCTDAARAAIRLGFHDSAGWSKSTGRHGGADGSIVFCPEELRRESNRGLEEIVEQTRYWYEKYRYYGISMADLIQLGANVATVICPLGPRIRTFVGRCDHPYPARDGLLPSPYDDPHSLIELFRQKTIEPHGLAALLGAHSTSQQRYFNRGQSGLPQDSTPGVWDVLYYYETLHGAPKDNVYSLPSDILLSEDYRIFPQYKAFAGPGGQEYWNYDYAREYVRVSLLGVYNINNLTDCSKVLPPAILHWD
ncbi:heme peroxidase [Cercophora scortea]|uniref:Peroxidase n=1 Tax=Cercophora scortea TaxID=314031 RepID=A0AAE0J2P2_9PEZI|nr:heme peroxidase [Cercophora scortea]